MPSSLEMQTGTATQGKENISSLAGKPAPKDALVDISRLEKEISTVQAEVIIMGLQHRAFNEPHLSWSTAYEVVCAARSLVLTIRSV